MSRIFPSVHWLKDGTEVIIRPAVIRDAEMLVRIKSGAVNEMHYMLREPDEFTGSISAEEDDIEKHLERDGWVYICAEVGERVAGFIQFENGWFRRTAHSGMMFTVVENEYRDKGLGAVLLSSLLKWAEENPIIEKVCLAVFSANERARALYTNMGFTEEGRCPRDMKLADGTYMDSILMYKFVKNF